MKGFWPCVAGHSKERNTCKIRHVRCDVRHLFCQHCEAEVVMRLPSKAMRRKLTVSQISELDRVCQISIHEEVRAFIDRVLLRHYTELSCEAKPGNPTDIATVSMLGISAESVEFYMYGKYTQKVIKVHQAFRLHGQTLDQLSAVICRHYHANHPLVTATPTTLSAWKEHVRGLEALINNYGPAAFHQEPMKQVFEQARMHIVVAYLDDVQQTFLEEEFWQEAPWRLVVEPNALRGSIARKILHLYTKLLQVRWLWEISNPSCCWEIPASKEHLTAASPIEKTAGKPLFESILVFSSFQRAIETNLYNCCILFLCDMEFQFGSLEELKQLPISRILDSSSSISNPHRLSDYDAECICRSIEFMLQPNRGPAGAYSAIFPLRVVLLIIEPWPGNEFRPKPTRRKNYSMLVTEWARSIMVYIADEYGFSVARNFN
ncbi:hypothetical protein ACQKWADRAFT_324804 [Trichoderma austrokoningii]